MSSVTQLTTFYDRPGLPNSSKTRVTSRSFILASNSAITYLPPKMWPQKKLSDDALVAGYILSPVLIDQISALTRKITTDKLDLTGLDVPSFNQYIYINGMVTATINEPSNATIKLNGKTFALLMIVLFNPGCHRENPELLLMFVNTVDFKDQICISLSLKQDTPNDTPSQKYFSTVGTISGNTKGIPISNLFKNLTGGAYTYLGSDIIPHNNGIVRPVTWYIFETPVSIATTDFNRLWSVVDPSGVMYAGPPQSTILNTTNVYYLPETQIFKPLDVLTKQVISTGQCKLVKAVEYYDPETGKLKASVEGNQIIPVASIMNPRKPDEKWIKDSPSGESNQSIEIPGLSQTVETIIAIIIGLVIAITFAFGIWKLVEYQKLPTMSTMPTMPTISVTSK